MVLRKAQKSDAPGIAAISIEVWVGTYLKRGVSPFFAQYVLNEFTASNSEKFIADPRHLSLVSEGEEGLDGFIRVSSGSAAPVGGCSDMEIATFYVQPRHHGKGIGKMLLEAAIEHCRERGAVSVWLTTNAENDPAIAFYLKRGFQQVGQSHFRIGNEGYLNNVYSYRFD